MNRSKPLRSLLTAAAGGDLKGSVILIVSPLLLITWWYFGSPRFYLDHLSSLFAPWLAPTAGAGVYTFLACFVLLGMVPALIVKLVFRENLADYGVRLGNRVRTIRSFVLMAPVMLIVALVASRRPAFAAEYPLNRSAGTSAAMFGFHACTYMLFYLGWEFHFRGFVQHGLRSTVGAAHAVLIQVLASTMVHLGRPAAETYGALLVGLLWGLLAFRTRSLLSGLLQHALLGISLDFFICFT